MKKPDCVWYLKLLLLFIANAVFCQWVVVWKMKALQKIMPRRRRFFRDRTLIAAYTLQTSSWIQSKNGSFIPTKLQTTDSWILNPSKVYTFINQDAAPYNYITQYPKRGTCIYQHKSFGKKSFRLSKSRAFFTWIFGWFSFCEKGTGCTGNRAFWKPDEFAFFYKWKRYCLMRIYL